MGECKEKEMKQIPLIFTAYAQLEGMNSGANLKRNAEENKDIYLKNCSVALISAKQNNPECDVALVTNTDVPKQFATLLESQGVSVYKVPFVDFCFDNGIRWGLAFYKLCALRAVIEKYPHEKYCMFDTDVYVQGSLENLWHECDYHIMMYDIDHGLQVENYRHLLTEIASFEKEDILISHYGGELFASNHTNAVPFIEECHKIYAKMRGNGFVTTHGDEFISNIAAHRMRDKVKNAGAYVYRFWTGEFRLISTCYQFNPVVVLHVPAEKENGMIDIFERYVKKGKLPTKEKAWNILRLKNCGFRNAGKRAVKKMLRLIKR